MIFVITGTEKFPIDRMVKEVDRLVSEKVTQQNVFVQLGSCLYEPKHCQWQRFFNFGDMCKNIEAADTVIAHAGAGTTLLCIQLGHRPLLIPRRKEFGEHVDNHQISFSKKFATTGMVDVLYDIKCLSNHINIETKGETSIERKVQKEALVRYLNEIIR
jgi:UDP-N-acetylglucosamine transferase subunit ALG13